MVMGSLCPAVPYLQIAQLQFTKFCKYQEKTLRSRILSMKVQNFEDPATLFKISSYLTVKGNALQVVHNTGQAASGQTVRPKFMNRKHRERKLIF